MFWRKVHIVSDSYPITDINHYVDTILRHQSSDHDKKQVQYKHKNSLDKIFNFDQDILSQLDDWIQHLQMKLYEINEGLHAHSHDEAVCEVKRKKEMNSIQHILSQIEDTKQYLFSECILKYEGDSSFNINERIQAIRNLYSKVEILQESIHNFQVKQNDFGLLKLKKQLNVDESVLLPANANNSCDVQHASDSDADPCDEGILSSPEYEHQESSLEDIEKEFKRTIQEFNYEPDESDSLLQNSNEHGVQPHCEIPPEEENMHVILHELISTLGQCNKPIDHDILDQLWHQMPEIEGFHYPTRSDFMDSFQRQSQMLCLMTKLYQQVSRHAMDTNADINKIYADPSCLKILMSTSPENIPRLSTPKANDECEDCHEEVHDMSDFLPATFLLHK